MTASWWRKTVIVVLAITRDGARLLSTPPPPPDSLRPSSSLGWSGECFSTSERVHLFRTTFDSQRGRIRAYRLHPFVAEPLDRLLYSHRVL